MQASQVTVGTTPVKVAAGFGGLDGSLAFLIKNLDGAATVYLGGVEVTASAGYPLAAGVSLSATLMSGNELWAVTASGAVTVAVLGES